jgi:RNA polymerase sigma factor (sigma-70 family)
MNPTLLANLIDHHGPNLVLFARQFGTQGEDLVQDALLKLVQQGKAPADPLAWLYRVVRRQAINQWRSQQRRQRREQKIVQLRDAFVEPLGESRLDQQFAIEALELLPLELREIIVAHLWGGLTFQQLAEVFDCSAATCYRRYESALQSLRQQLNCTKDEEMPR